MIAQIALFSLVGYYFLVRYDDHSPRLERELWISVYTLLIVKIYNPVVTRGITIVLDQFHCNLVAPSITGLYTLLIYLYDA